MHPCSQGNGTYSTGVRSRGAGGAVAPHVYGKDRTSQFLIAVYFALIIWVHFKNIIPIK